MPKKQRLIVIGESELPLDKVVLKIPLSALAQLLTEEKKEATQECITQLRPFVSGQIGRSRLDDIQEEFVLVEKEVVEEPDYVFIDENRGQVIRDVDFREVFQVIRRKR